MPGIGRLRRQLASLTPRQGAALAVGGAVGAAAVVAAATDQPAVALGLLSVLAVALCAGQVQLRRRLAQQDAARRAEHRHLRGDTSRLRRDLAALHADLRTLADETANGQRRLVAAVEKERLAAADRHAVLRGLVSGSGPVSGNGRVSDSGRPGTVSTGAVPADGTVPADRAVSVGDTEAADGAEATGTDSAGAAAPPQARRTE